MPDEASYAKAEHVATITIRTADGTNALGAGLAGELRAALAEAQADRDVRVVVLSASGENFLVDDVRPPDEAGGHEGDLFGLLGVDVTDALLDLDKPIIAAVNGVAAGVGCDVALCCDLRIAADSATIGPSQIKRGVLAGAALYFLPRIVRFGAAAEMVFTGELVDAAAAGASGLFDRVVPAAELPVAAQEFAAKIAAGPPVAMRLTKRALYRGLAINSDTAKEYTVLCRSLGMQSTGESREGFNSFSERRAPNF